MPQHDYILDNQPGAAFRADLNNALAAIVQLNSGAGYPATTYPYMWWMETPLDGSPGVLKQRNSANSDWLVCQFPNLLNGSVVIGLRANGGSGTDNVIIGEDSGPRSGAGGGQVAVGKGALGSLTSGSGANTAVGYDAMATTTGAVGNTAVGESALRGTSSGNGSSNAAVGARAMYVNVSGYDSCAFGAYALYANTTGYENAAMGKSAMFSNVSGSSNTAAGFESLYSNLTGSNNAAFGWKSLRSNTASDNTAVGSQALVANTTGTQNTAVGYAALSANTSGNYCTAVGRYALYTSNYSNATGLGSGAAVTGDNQVQLGNAITTTYVYGTVQNRSDLRDKADVRDTVLGLAFVNRLRPVDYRWDLRDDYRAQPPELPESATPEERAAAHATWVEANRLSNLTRDGSKKRTRYHHGLIAQEVAALIQATGMDFGGYQDHSIQGGEDVLSIGYDELIAPLIKAVQELSARVVELETRLSE